ADEIVIFLLRPRPHVRRYQRANERQRENFGGGAITEQPGEGGVGVKRLEIAVHENALHRIFHQIAEIRQKILRAPTGIDPAFFYDFGGFGFDGISALTGLVFDGRGFHASTESKNGRGPTNSSRARAQTARARRVERKPGSFWRWLCRDDWAQRNI